MITLPITADDVTTIVAMEDPVLRNLWITQSYADFSQRLRAAVSADDLTWCGFAVWASGTAGLSIREEELPGFLSRIIKERHGDHIQRINAEIDRRRLLRFILSDLDHVDVLRAIRGALDTVSERIAHGNALVYGELAPLFVAFLEWLEGTPADDDVDAVLDRAAAEPIDDDVREAFHWYRRALGASSAGERAHAVLAANVLAVAHEQPRLHDAIAASLTAGVLPAGDVRGELLPRWIPNLLAKLIRGPVAREAQRLIDDVWDSVTTALLMTLRVPGATLHLSHDVPPGPGGLRVPGALEALDDVPPDTVFRTWDRTGGSGVGSGAANWASLGDRMNYIVNLFRSRQQDPSLHDRPFSPEQLATMQNGRVPDGPLLPPG